MTSSQSVLVDIPKVFHISARNSRSHSSSVLGLSEHPHKHLCRVVSTLYNNLVKDDAIIKARRTFSSSFSYAPTVVFEPASQNDFYLAQIGWVNSTKTQKMIRSSDDHVNFVALRSVIKGCAKNSYVNSFVGGPVEKEHDTEHSAVALDSEMQQFARIRICNNVNGVQYLMWLGFARRATLIQGTYAYTTHGPPLRVPPHIFKAAPLLSNKFSVADVSSINI